MSEAITPHGGNLTEEARRLGVQKHQLLDASASLVPFPLPKKLTRCLKNALSESVLREYPDRTHKQLREAIGAWHGIESAMVLPGNGAAELFTWAAREAASLGLSGLPSPGFADYSRALRCWHAPHKYLPIPLSWSAAAPQHFPLKPTTDVIWITNPHNPTGQLWSRESIETLLQSHSLVICDEAFLPLVPDGERQSLLPLVKTHSNLVVIRSLTKLFALAGLRLGYAVSKPDRLNHWQSWRDPWPLNGLALTAGTFLMTDISALKQWIDSVHQWIGKEKPWLEEKLRNMPGINPHPSSSNFLLIEGDMSLNPLREQMARRNILLRDCRSFSELGERWLRIGLQNRVGNHRIVEAMRELLS